MPFAWELFPKPLHFAKEWAHRAEQPLCFLCWKPKQTSRRQSQEAMHESLEPHKRVLDGRGRTCRPMLLPRVRWFD